MNSRERFLKTLNHESAGGVCVDFGSTPVSGIHVSVVAGLRDYFGLEKQLVKAYEPYQMLGWIEEDLKETLGVDIDGIVPRNTMFGFPNENWQEFRMPWGQEVLVSEHFRTITDSHGDLLIYPQGDTHAPASGRMPKSSFFFDTIIRQDPIDDNNLHPEDNLEEFQPISDVDLQYFKNEVDKLADSPRGRIANFGGTAFGDIALVPAPFLKRPKGIRDVSEWYMSTAIRQDYIEEVFTRQCEIAVANLQKIHALIGDSIQAVFICGTDFGTQTSQFCSPKTYDTLYAPYHKKVNDWIHANTSWKTFKHSCGAVEPLLSHFVESGFDIINPVQCSATGMDSQTLKNTYGKDLVFWGGGVDTQQVLPFGTPDEVYQQVRERIEIFNREGGFVFNTIHNIQANTPVENVVAMLKPIQEYKR
jgi:uroporphyrinogen decarboxylase-like protein